MQLLRAGPEPPAPMSSAEPERMSLPPDAYVAATVAGALLLEFLAPVDWLPTPGLVSPVTLLGAGATAAGLALEIAAARALAGAGTSTRPRGMPTALVTHGPFRVTRNPFYCGLLLLVAGIFAAFALEWGLLGMPLLWLALDRLVVPREEARLTAAFGSDFARYAAKTPRWLFGH